MSNDSAKCPLVGKITSLRTTDLKEQIWEKGQGEEIALLNQNYRTISIKIVWYYLRN